MLRNLGVLAAALLAVVALALPNAVRSAASVGQSLDEWAEIFTREWALKSPRVALHAVKDQAIAAAIPPIAEGRTLRQSTALKVKTFNATPHRTPVRRRVSATLPAHDDLPRLDGWAVYAESLVRHGDCERPRLSIARFRIVVWRTSTAPSL